MAYVSIPKDLSRVKSKFLFNLTKRQVVCFGLGALHNPENRRKVTGELSTMEFSIAMLASGGWTNKEIGEHLGISINTVKHYLTDIFCKLNVKKRDELKKFMLK